ncbi:hypothetical protein A1O3_05350 [Capronia epimyces CBS 606.96]|uniref:RRM domain-containing protein n=1 Tax=Capronia epimyces CBS 606.96 TaxID=1182542 RepID=W9Y4V3_9EURO|nr:uncharacterized protein A1O3_05350 [Capronia epimyces CBS 606.96]EXJ84680.1 hypothetical protein A1O3_05350 [Capronia epimyces CBS 606.96]
MANPTKGRSGGVLTVNAATRKNAAPQSGSGSTPRAPTPRLRLVIRRLPPGLTEAEFWAALGDEWKVGAGKTEWAAFKNGKISKDVAKPSRPSRAYVKVKEQSLLDVLATAIKDASFQDAKNTSKDPCLLGPPSLEFAPYNKTPSGRTRHDGRQGTIDQDQEFIDFLQSLTEPITKAASNGVDSGEGKSEKVSTTPLVQYIKEKKANKAKESSQAKAAKARESKEAKTSKSETRPTVVVKGKNSSVAEKDKDKEKERVAKATQDAVKAISKSVAAMPGKQNPAKAEAKPSTKEPTSQPAPAPARKERERGNASAAARMLQRDLGLVAKESKSQRTSKASSSTPSNTAETATGSSTKAAATSAPSSKSADTPAAQQKQATSTPSTPTTTAPPTGPRASRPASTASASGKASTTASQRSSKTGPQPSSGAKSAFLKHANPSQGITEDVLRSVFQQFGTITRCEIDKKKGLGYIDFSEADALKKAMAASPVKVADGQVVVLENKPQHGKRGGQGAQNQGSSGTTKAAAGTAAQTQAQAQAQAQAPAKTSSPKVATASTATAPNPPSTQTSTTPATTAGSTPPTATRGTTRGGGGAGAGGGRGGRGSNARGSGSGSGTGSKQGQGQRGGKGGGRRGGGGGGGGGPTSTSDSTTTAATAGGGGGGGSGGSANANANAKAKAKASEKAEAKKE